MKLLYRFFSPMILGIVMFNCIRLTTDLLRDGTLWPGSMKYHLSALLVTITMCYVFDFENRYFLSRIKPKLQLSAIMEYALMILKVLVIMNLVLFVGERTELLYLGNLLTDYVVVNVICIPFFLIYYIILRSNQIEEDYNRQTLQLEKARLEQLEMELKFLKSQYHPHFLFNALNTVYFQIDEKNLLPRRTLEMISDLLRYQLYGGNQMVSIQEEINYMRTYIDLQKMRMSERLQLHVEFPSGLECTTIYPLLFLPLIENAFKYVGGAYRLDIRMTWEPDKISFYIRNSVPDIPIPINPVKKGIGLENLKRRLALLYPDKYTLETSLLNNEYVVQLILEINKP